MIINVMEDEFKLNYKTLDDVLFKLKDKPKYLIMSDDTRTHYNYYDPDIYANFRGCYIQYMSIPVAICNKLGSGEVDIIF